nr:unnamed protein product [Callosobruchus analis]
MTSGADLTNIELLTKLVELIKKESNTVKTEIKQEIQEVRFESSTILNNVREQDEKLEQLTKQTNSWYKKICIWKK